ncbi:secretin and TonB N-terminal domain-containing protein [Gloeothece verrucosa]|uniref:Type II and III secretion system protein n=1 Tax=Gloeothece verrucosa (strain PCC 7822) TaxID=497965 RepID=E0UHF2_GLOV7|nr:secretin and TonB N-terminal domain-containing protein [Gloeothece verrucosa]ADN12093.1 type II and III secretion system protein [Gloeothece verrucosa PCC 7822]
MYNYHYPLILGGVASIFVAIQPSLLASPESSDSHSEKPPIFNGFSHQTLTTETGAETFSIESIGKDIRESSITEPETSSFPQTSSLNFPLEKNEELKDKKLLAQSSPMLPNPDIVIEDKQKQTQPTTPAFPVLPRAVAPPVGDMAVSNIDSMAQTIDLGTAAIIPRLVLREAPAREVLAVLARYAGFNLIFTDSQTSAAQGQGQQGAVAPQGQQTVSLDLENESVQEVFNSVLMVSGLKANRRGRTIFVGTALPAAARNLITRTIRLNQVEAINAATFLATQGAEYQRLVTQTEDITDPLTGRVVGRRETPPGLYPLTVVNQAGVNSPLLLQGLSLVADQRLNSITLIGEPRQVEIATSMLVQLDARRRQVAVNVKVVDVQLQGTQSYSSRFSFGFDDGFFLQDNGTAILNFGNYNPPTSAQTNASVVTPPVISVPDALGGLTPNIFFDQQNAPFGNFNSGSADILRTANNTIPYARPSFGTFNNPFQPGVSAATYDAATGQRTFTYQLPNLFQFPQKFLATLQASITSGNAKILTDPTLVVQEGQQATVKLTQKVVESVNTQVDPLSGVRTTTPVLQDAGLTLTVEVDRIDDNGFVSLFVSPTIAAPGATQTFDSGNGSNNTLTLLSRREMTSGLIRMRDGQTLILSGIISETERTTVTKVPILGDIPILGALFRRTDNNGNRSEVIVLLTPKIIDDRPDATFGINYNPGPGAAELLRRQGFPVQPK